MKHYKGRKVLWALEPPLVSWSGIAPVDTGTVFKSILRYLGTSI